MVITDSPVNLEEIVATCIFRDAVRKVSEIYSFEGMVLFLCAVAVPVLYMLQKVLYIWFFKYKLRYLLRITVFIFSAMLLLNMCCHPSAFESDTGEFPFCKSTFTLRSKLTFVSGIGLLILLIIRFHWSIPLEIDMISPRFRKYGYPETTTGKNISTTSFFREQMNQRYPGELPPLYPNGWIPIAESSEVKKGRVITINALGKKFCVFRNMEGKAYVLDTCCPYQETNSPQEGAVSWNCIQCPFHGWKISDKEHFSKNPDSYKSYPKSWATCERNSFIFVWYHAEEERPSWEIPYLGKNLKARGKSVHQVFCHMQDIPENGADANHFSFIHKQFFLLPNKWIDLERIFLKVLKYTFEASWTVDEHRQHVAWANIIISLHVFGFKFSFLKYKTEAEQIGPAFVHVHIKSAMINGIFQQCNIPEGPLSVRTVQTFYTETKLKQFFADLFMKGESLMFERDVDIFSKKQYRHQPVLVPEDKLIKSFRRWYSQFYSANSPTLRNIREQRPDSDGA